MSITTLSSTVYTNLVSGHVGRGEECEAEVCTMHKLSSTVSSNFMYMNHGTLYMVSASYSATCHSGIHLLSESILVCYRQAVVVSIMSQGHPFWLNDRALKCE